jgi:non-homologous end joining protein Ku
MIELIRSKQAGLPAPKEKPTARPANVVNLIDVFRRSVEYSKRGSKPAAGKKAAAAAETSSKRRTKSARA